MISQENAKANGLSCCRGFAYAARPAILLWLLILLAIASEARADCGRIWMPPDQYLRPVTVPVLPVHMPWRDVHPYCLSHGVRADIAEGRMWACTFRSGSGNYIVALSDDFTPEEDACMLIHERAHMPPNNWPFDHPGRRFR